MSDGIIPWEVAVLIGVLLAIPLAVALVCSIHYYSPPPWDACGVCSHYGKWCPHKDDR